MSEGAREGGPLRVNVVTVFPPFFEGPLSLSIPARARAAGAVEYRLVHLRDFTHDRHRSVDDYPYGGGPGMVMRPAPFFEAVEALGAGGPPLALTVERATPFKGGLIVRFAELADRTAADLWRDRALLVPYAELPPPADDEVYLHELVGMRVVHKDGAEAGEVVDLVELPQGIALDVRLAGTERTALVPYRPELVVGVDVPARTVTVDVPEGLLE